MGKQKLYSSKYMSPTGITAPSMNKTVFGTWRFQKKKSRTMGLDWSWFTLLECYSGFILFMTPFHRHRQSACEAIPRSMRPAHILLEFGYQMSVQEPCYKTVKQPANEKALSKHKKIRGKSITLLVEILKKGRKNHIEKTRKQFQ